MKKIIIKKQIADLVQDHVSWLYSPNKDFEDQKPIDMLETEEGIERLERMIYRMKTGQPS